MRGATIRVSRSTHLGLELCNLLQSHRVSFGDDRDHIDLVLELAHHFNVQLLEAVIAKVWGERN